MILDQLKTQKQLTMINEAFIDILKQLNTQELQMNKLESAILGATEKLSFSHDVQKEQMKQLIGLLTEIRDHQRNEVVRSL